MVVMPTRKWFNLPFCPLALSRGTKVHRSYQGDNPFLRPTDIAAKLLPSPTNREHRKIIGVKVMSLGTKYSSYCLERCQYVRIRITIYEEDCLMCCPSNEVIKTDSKHFLALGGLHEDTLCDTLQTIPPTNAKTIHQTSLLHIESNLDRLGLLSPTHGG